MTNHKVILNKDFLYDEYIIKNKTVTQISKEINHHPNTVRRNLKEYKIGKYIKHQDREWLYNKYINELKSTETIAKEVGVDGGTIWYWLNKLKIPIRSISEAQTGALHRGWKGGRTSNRGYIYLLMPEHHRANSNGYVREHILIMEKKLGIPIKRTEVIHHIDGNPSNNDPNNLHLYKNHSEHNKAKTSLFKIGYRLYKEGKLSFNHNKGIYEL